MRGDLVMCVPSYVKMHDTCPDEWGRHRLISHLHHRDMGLVIDVGDLHYRILTCHDPPMVGWVRINAGLQFTFIKLTKDPT